MPIKRNSRTRSSVKQPVRFYKFVALTFLFITIALFGVILFTSSQRAHIIIVSKSDPVDARFSVDIGGSESSVSGVVEVVDIEVEEVFQPKGNKKEPSNSEGLVTIFNESSREQPLVPTTRFLSSDGILFL